MTKKKSNALAGPMTVIGALICLGYALAMPPGYKGKPFQDQFHKSGPQLIPGTLQCALYDLGGALDGRGIDHRGSAEFHHDHESRPWYIFFLVLVGVTCPTQLSRPAGAGWLRCLCDGEEIGALLGFLATLGMTP
ncbi:MAG: hypothetical protein ABSB75_02625, partial [Candidatus Limnocylindrales bacterium]